MKTIIFGALLLVIGGNANAIPKLCPVFPGTPSDTEQDLSDSFVPDAHPLYNYPSNRNLMSNDEFRPHLTALEAVSHSSRELNDALIAFAQANARHLSVDQVHFMRALVNPFLADSGAPNFVSAYDKVAEVFYKTNKENLTAQEAMGLVLNGSIPRYSSGDQERILDVIATFGSQIRAEDMHYFMSGNEDLRSLYWRWQIRRALKNANPSEYQKYVDSTNRESH